MVSIFLLYRSAHSELAPQEDQGFVLAQSTLRPMPPCSAKFCTAIRRTT